MKEYSIKDAAKAVGMTEEKLMKVLGELAPVVAEFVKDGLSFESAIIAAMDHRRQVLEELIAGKTERSQKYRQWCFEKTYIELGGRQ